MIIKEYIKNFGKLGFGLFVHFGLYSMLGKGEWVKYCFKMSDTEYNLLYKKFNPNENWAETLVEQAKKCGCKYITLTTRHHDGFSLYSTNGLNDFDSIHGCGRDLVKEFVVACRKNGIVPFFYHTLIDWNNHDYETDFPSYLKYLRSSIELLCKNYGTIGGFWFDGMWDKPNAEWEEETLYSLIRKYQPNAMIINNTGLYACGEKGNIEIDSVTFERGTVREINTENSAKYLASEMCQIFGDHWGYAENDLNFKSVASMIEDLASCRRFGANYLLNVGLMGNGELQPIEKAMLDKVGQWARIYRDIIYTARPTKIQIKEKPKDFLMTDGRDYYLFVHDLPVFADENVALKSTHNYNEIFKLEAEIKRVVWVDSGSELSFTQKNGKVNIISEPFHYGNNTVVRVAKIEMYR